MRYFVRLGRETREVELTGAGVRVGDEDLLPAELARVPGRSLRHLRIGDSGYLLSARRAEDGWEIRMDGRRAVVRVEDQRSRALRELTGEGRSGGGPRRLVAPMPGLVVRVLVEKGQRVDPGESLLVMEAMKMENELKAESAGTVGGVEVREGETVEQGEVLVTLLASEEEAE